MKLQEEGYYSHSLKQVSWASLSGCPALGRGRPGSGPLPCGTQPGPEGDGGSLPREHDPVGGHVFRECTISWTIWTQWKNEYSACSQSVTDARDGLQMISIIT